MLPGSDFDFLPVSRRRGYADRPVEDRGAAPPCASSSFVSKTGSRRAASARSRRTRSGSAPAPTRSTSRRAATAPCARRVSGTMGTLSTLLDRDHVDEIAQGLRHADLVGFSSMTGYAELTRSVIRRVRELNPSSYIVWGGIHPIIEPEDAIQADVDAICTGEGEFAFEQLIVGLEEGRDVTGTPNFWFRGKDGEPIKSKFLPLQTAEEMETLPFPAVRRRLRADLRGGQGVRAAHRRRLPAQRRARLSRALVDRLPAPLQLLRKHEVHRERRQLPAPPASERALHRRADQGREAALPAPLAGELPRRQLHGDPLRRARRVRGALARRGRVCPSPSTA